MKQNQPKPFIEKIKSFFQMARPFAIIILLVLMMSSSSIPDIRAKITVLIALAALILYLTIDVYNTIKSKLDDVNTSLFGINQNIKNIQDPLYKTAFGGKLGKPEIQVAVKLYKASEIAAMQLKKPKQVFKNQESYINELMQRINQMILSKRGKIYAACGEKDWKYEGTKRWFSKNYEALKSNISINRIFLEEAEWDKESAKLQMQEQANNGISVRVVALNVLKKNEFLNNIPRGFGFVIFDYGNNTNEVIVHNDTTNINEKSVLFDNPMIVGQFMTVFNEISADAFSTKIESDNKTSAGIRLEKEILHKSEEMTFYIRHLLDHRFSNLQLNFLNWRFGTELEKIRKVLNGEISIYALEKFDYLSDVFGHLLKQLKAGDLFQTISTVDIWSGKNIGNQKFLVATSKALMENATIERIIFIDRKRLLEGFDKNYREQINEVIHLFENYHGISNDFFLLKFFIADLDGEYAEVLQFAPTVLITEAGNKNKLGIRALDITNINGKSKPYLSLSFHGDNETNESIDNFIENFEPIKSKSLTIDQLKEKLNELV